jgi:hypothetical protein
MNARAKAITKVGLITLAALAVIGGSVYAAKNSGDLLAKPRSALVHMVNEFNLSPEDRVYLLQTNASQVDQRQAVSIFDQYVMDGLPADQKLAYISGKMVGLAPDNAGYLIDSLVEGAGVPKTLDVCSTNVFNIAGPIQQLDQLQDQLLVTSTDNYGPILGTMAKRVGTDLYTDITQLFNGGK